MLNYDRYRMPGVYILVLALFVLVSCAEAPPAGTVSDGEVAVTFTCQPSGTPGGIYLAGTFNDWNDSSDQMADDDGDGTYEIMLLLESGTYQYKFVQDGQWFEDPSSEEYTDDGFGGRNSVLNVPSGVNEMVVGAGRGKTAERVKPAKKATAGTVEVTFLFEGIIKGQFN